MNCLNSGAIESHLIRTCPNCQGILARRRALVWLDKGEMTIIERS